MNKGTRSGLLWEVERLLKETEELPQVLLMENVIQVHSEGDNMNNFQKWIEFLESLGYSNYWQDMNAKNYGMPQNRNRTIMVSILGEYQFKFPQKVELEKDAYDYLIDTVDEKYYLNNENTQILVDNLKKNGTILTDRQTDRQTWLVDKTINEPKESIPINCITRRYDNGIGHRKQDGTCVCEHKRISGTDSI